MNSDEKREYAIELLKSKAAELGRLPKREDFSPETVCLIKQKLGPFPRALEAAGLKQAVRPSSAERNRLKRQRAKAAKKQASKMNNGGNKNEVK